MRRRIVGARKLFRGLLVTIGVIVGLIGFVIAERVRTSRPSAGVSVCRSWNHGFAGLDGLECDADIGSAPILPPKHLLCLSDLSGVKDKRIGVQLFYGPRLIKHRNFHSSKSETTAYAEVVPSDIVGLRQRRRLPAGHYRCRFLVNGKVIHARAFTVA